MRSTIAALILTLALSGCVTGRGVGPVKCVGLQDPPETVVDALEGAARKDASAAAWVIGLDGHYEKLDVCRKAGK